MDRILKVVKLNIDISLGLKRDKGMGGHPRGLGKLNSSTRFLTWVMLLLVITPLIYPAGLGVSPSILVLPVFYVMCFRPELVLPVRQFWLWLSLCLVILAASIHSGASFLTELGYQVRYFKFILIFMVAVNLPRRMDKDLAICMGVVAMVVYGLSWLMWKGPEGVSSVIEEIVSSGRASGFEAGKRFYGILGNPNEMALFAFFVGSITAVGALRWRSLFLLTVAVLSVLVVLLSQSRTVMLAIFCCLPLVFAFIRFSWKRLLIVTGSTTLVLGLTFVLGFDYLFQMFKQFDITQVHSLALRLEIWGRAWELIQMRPLFGWGDGPEVRAVIDGYADNEWIQVLLQYGAFAVVLTLAFLVSIRPRLGDKSPWAAIYAFVFTGGAVAMLTGPLLFSPTVAGLFFMIAGLGLRGALLPDRSKN